MIGVVQRKQPAPTLSNVERVICEHLAAGDTCKMIGARYGLPEANVKIRVRRIRDRFGALTATHLIDILRRGGLLNDPKGP